MNNQLTMARMTEKCDVMLPENHLTIDELTFQIEEALPRQIAYEQSVIASSTASQSGLEYSERHIASRERLIAKYRGIRSCLILEMV